MSFEEYNVEVRKAFDRWVDALRGQNKKTDEYKEATQDLISEWKRFYPAKIRMIDDIISAHYARRFQ